MIYLLNIVIFQSRIKLSPSSGVNWAISDQKHHKNRSIQWCFTPVGNWDMVIYLSNVGFLYLLLSQLSFSSIYWLAWNCDFHQVKLSKGSTLATAKIRSLCSPRIAIHLSTSHASCQNVLQQCNITRWLDEGVHRETTLTARFHLQFMFAMITFHWHHEDVQFNVPEDVGAFSKPARCGV